MPITIETKHPVAFESPDHVVPLGTKHDNSTNARFVALLDSLYPEKELSILDMGCSGGAFVKTCIDMGHVAVGLEGSDFSKKKRRAEWRTIPESLFTCDITRPFRLLQDGKPMKFDVITAWEVMEHIREEDLPGLCDNVKSHLEPGGLWVMSVANFSCVYRGMELHQTRKPKEWWIGKMKENGLVYCEDYLKYFQPYWVRGVRETKGGFHLVVTNDEVRLARLPAQSLRDKMMRAFHYWWMRSPPQKLIWEIVHTESV